VNAMDDDNQYVMKNEFYHHMLKVERRLSRLEVIFYINLFITLVTLLKTLIG
jgi:hypothetical protein